MKPQDSRFIDPNKVYEMSQLFKRKSVKKSDSRVVSGWSLRFEKLQFRKKFLVFWRENVYGNKGLRLWILLSVQQKID